MPYLYETWSKLPTHELLILSKSHEDRAKIVGLLLINSQVWDVCLFFWLGLYIFVEILGKPSKHGFTSGMKKPSKLACSGHSAPPKEEGGNCEAVTS